MTQESDIPEWFTRKAVRTRRGFVETWAGHRNTFAVLLVLYTTLGVVFALIGYRVLTFVVAGVIVFIGVLVWDAERRRREMLDQIARIERGEDIWQEPVAGEVDR